MAIQARNENILHQETGNQTGLPRMPKIPVSKISNDTGGDKFYLETNAQLFDLLTEEEKKLAKRYYQLKTTPAFLDSDIFEHLIAIWEKVSEDTPLSKILELIDDLCIDLSTEDTEKDNDRRAYLSEYLIPQIELALNVEHDLLLMMIECPDKQHRSIVALPNEPQTIDQFKDTICDYCGNIYREHAIKTLTGSGR